MKISLAVRIFGILFAGCIVAQAATLTATGLLRKLSLLAEQDLYRLSAASIAAELGARDAGRDAVRQAFADLHALSPDLEPYLLTPDGSVVESRDGESLGFPVPMEPILEALRLVESSHLRCGISPEEPGGCVAFSVAPLVLQSEPYLVYIPVAHGMGRYFSTFGGVRRLLRFLLPGMGLALLLSSALSATVAWHLTKGLRGIRRVVARYAAGDFTSRFDHWVEDDLQALGHSLNDLGETVAERRAQLETATQRRARLLAALIHDLRRPVQAITMLAERWTRHPAGDSALPGIREAIRAERLLLEALPSSTGPNDAELSRTHRPANALRMLQQAADSLEPLIRSRSQSLRIEIGAVRGQVIGRESDLFRIFLNLLDNASRYTPEGGDITARCDERDGLVVAEIADSGIGVVAGEEEKIFQPGFRSASGRSLNQSGSGLGLSIVKMLVSAHGGTIQAKRGHTGGTVFRVSLPTTANRIVPVVPSAPEPPQRTSRLWLFERPGFLYETSGSSALLVLYVHARYFSEPNRAILGPIEFSLVLVGLIAVIQLLHHLGVDQTPGRRRAFWLIRALLFSCLSLNLATLGTTAFRPPATADRLFSVRIIGFLCGLGMAAGAPVTEGLPTAILLGLPALRLVFENGRVSLELALFVSFVGAVLLAAQVRQRRFRSMLRRTTLLVFIVLFDAVGDQAILAGADPRRLLTASVPILDSALLTAIDARLPASLPSSESAQHIPEPVLEFMLRLSEQSPRLALTLVRQGRMMGGISSSGSAINLDLELPEALRARLVNSGDSPELISVDGALYGVVPVRGFPGANLVVGSDGVRTDVCLRKAGSMAISLYVLAALAAVLLLSAIVSRIAFHRLQFQIRAITSGLQRFRQSGERFQPLETGGEELDATLRDLERLCERISAAIEALGRAEGRTAELIEHTRDALAERLQTLCELLPPDESPAAISLIDGANEAQARVLSAVFDALIAVPPNTAAPMPLGDLVEECVLEVALSTEAPRGEPIRYETADDLAVPCDAAELKLLIEVTLRSLQGRDGRCVTAERTDAGTELRFTFASMRLGAVRAECRLYDLLSSMLADRLQARRNDASNAIIFTFPGTTGDEFRIRAVAADR